ncbi:MAG: hypothetical protein MJZ86_02115 [Bacteroidales bacterium]|nr:hypothetical protein [Bacteroidales bacterium]
MTDDLKDLKDLANFVDAADAILDFPNIADVSDSMNAKVDERQVKSKLTKIAIVKLFRPDKFRRY